MTTERRGNHWGQWIVGVVLFVCVSPTGPLLGDEALQPAADRQEPLRFGILPKAETGALRFLKAHPEFDGRDIVIAIFDTGVDPGAEGLRAGPDGAAKVIDMIDGTGSGDVLMTQSQQPKDGYLQGRTGRRLRIDPVWSKLTKNFRVGMKAGNELFNIEFLPRYQAERKKRFDEQHRLLELNLRQRLQSAKGKQKQELQVQLDQLRSLSNHPDPGPVFDCVVFHDGFSWRAVVDTDEDGDLRDEKLLTNYRAEKRYATFPGAELNFAVNIYEDGSVLSIVADAGGHGTHVAGIVAAYYPDRPDWNGLAPGAKIVSVKIGDTRLASMETGVGLVRGIQAVIDNRCDLVNMSYGEATSQPNSGKILERLSRLVDHHGVVFIAAAGNEGPALTTVIAPASAESVIGVGAYVSPQMAEAAYALRQKAGDVPYTWSSRGPAADGGRTVDVFAPGGAIAPVPQWSLRPSARMNGTSMASPNACGAVALLLSAAKQQSWSYSPELIRRCLQDSAIPIADSTGATPSMPGMLQVDRAYQSLKDQQGRFANWGYRTQLRGSSRRGVYLREAESTRSRRTFQINVRTIYPVSATHADRIAFRSELALSASQPWVNVGRHLWVDGHGGDFEIQVDPTQLTPGVHSAEVTGFDVQRPQWGTVLRVPITVVIPQPLDGIRYSSRLQLRAGGLQRTFLAVPAGATWAQFRLSLRGAGRKRMLLQAVQLLDGKDFRAALQLNWNFLDGDGQRLWSIPVHGGKMMEFCLGQYWSSLGETDVEWQVEFHSLIPEDRVLQLRSGDPPRRVRLSSHSADQRAKPQARLTTHRESVSPVSSDLNMLSPDRDLIDGRIAYRLVLEYPIAMSQAGQRTPRFPALDGYLYDARIESQTWELFDEGGYRIAMDDMWPQSVRLPRGKNRLRLALRSSDVKLLQTMKSLRLSLDRRLSSPITVTVHESLSAAKDGGSAAGARLLRSESSFDYYVRSPATSRMPSEAKPGDLLIGTISYGEKGEPTMNDGQRPGGYPLQVVVGPKGSDSPDDAKPVVKMADKASVDSRLRRQQLELLQSMSVTTPDEVFESLAAKLEKELPDPMPVLQTRLHRLDHVSVRKQHLEQVVAACDAVLAKIDRQFVAEHLGVRSSAQQAKVRRQRDILADTLYRKGRALGYMELPDVISRQPIKDAVAHDRAFEANFVELQRWVDTTSSDYFLLHVRRERRRGNPGAALKVLNAQMKSASPQYWHYKKRLDLFQDLGWHHLADYEKTWKLLRFPKEEK